MKFIFSRLSALPLTLLTVTFITFGILYIVPGDTIDVIAGESVADPVLKAQLATEYGLDRPFLIQYFDWVWNGLQGNLGKSTSSHKPVTELIAHRLGLTAQLAIMGTLFSVLIGIVAGLTALRFRKNFIGKTIMFFSAIGMSIPSFVSATLLVLFISTFLPRLGVVSYIPFTENPWKSILSLLFPAISLAIVSGAMFTRYVLGAGTDILRNSDYVRTATAKGASSNRVLLKHVLPNSILPLVTVSGLEFAQLMGGAVLVETVFSLPGVGRMIITAIGERDYPVVQGGVLIVTLSYVVLNLLVDLIYPLIDPRIRMGKVATK